VKLADDLPAKPTLTIHDTKFDFCNIDYLKSILPFDPTDRKERLDEGLIKLHEVKDMPPNYLGATSQGNSLNSMWNKLEPAFDLFKGFVEFQFSAGSQRFGSNNKPRAKFPHPQWCIVYDGMETINASTFTVTEHKDRKSVV